MLIQTYAKYLVVISFTLLSFSVCERARALTVSPVKAELSGDPGETIEGEMTLFNEQKEDKEPKTFYSSFANFEARGETGTPYFTSAAEGLATWIKTSKKVVLKPGEQKTVAFSIAIPKNAEPGGYFAAIFWSTTPPGSVESGEQVSVSGRLGVLILLTVNGEVKEGGGILELGAGGKQGFFSSLPITFEYRFQNGSGNRVKPEGEIKIKNLFGGALAALDANKGQGNILPGSIRKFTVTWTGEEESGKLAGDKTQAANEISQEIGFFGMVKKQWSNFLFGRYSADLNLKYGSGEEAKTSFSFWIIPWQLLSVIFIVLVIGGFLLFKGIKKYNLWIIAQARGGK